MKKKIFTLLLAMIASMGTMSAAITVRLDPSSCTSWSTVRLWAWTDEGNLFDSWPGQIVSTDDDGWYSYTFDASITSVNIIWNNGNDQTIDITNVSVSTCFALIEQTGNPIGVNTVDCTTGQYLSTTGNHVPIGDLYYNLSASGNTAEVTSGNYKFSSVTIPSSVIYNGVSYTVTSIGERTFQGCSSLTSVTIPNSVTSIGDYAFYNCSSLTSINIDSNNPNYSSVDGVLFNKDKTTLVAYPGGKQGAYTIPNSVTSIGDNAFSGCSSLTSVTIPNSVTSIGDYAFYNCSSLTSVTIGNSVTSIGSSAFSTCSSLTSVTINSDAIVNKAYTSSSKSNLSNIFGSQVAKYIIGDNVKGIGRSAFWDCNRLTSVTIGNSVTSIGDNAFYSCDSLSSVTIGNSVTSIGSDAFSGCPSLTSVTIPNSVTSIGDWAFYNCSSLTSVTIGNSVTSIGAAAFRGCSSLTSITIPNSVTSIRENAFYDCSSLTSIDVASDNLNYCTVDGVLFNKEQTELNQYPIAKSYTQREYTIPNSVTSIGDYAFWRCGGLTSVTIPNSVTSIGQSAFNECTRLISITIPNSVTSIGGWAFFNCRALTSVTVKAETPPTLGSYAFYNEHINTNYPIYVPCDTLDTYKTAWADYASRIKDAPLSYKISTHAKNGNVDVASLGNYTTCDTEPYYKLTAVPNYGYHFVQWNDGNTDNPRTIILASDTSFTAEFAHNPIITYVYNSQMGTVSGPTITTTGVAVEYITFNATPNYGCHFVQWSDGLKDNPRIAQITQDTTFTAEFAYDRVGTCGKDLALTWSYDPNSKVLTIGNAGEFTENMRFGVEAPGEMEELVIGNSVTAIGENAFAGISTLKKVTIGESVKTIHNNAFYNCVNLETIFNYRPTPTNAYSTAFDGVDKFACSLYVLPSSIDMYKNASVWRDFYYTYAIGAEETTVTTNNVTVEPQDNAATLTWPTSENAATYTIEITKDGVVFCTLIFNANGQLTGIAFAPSRDGQAHAPAAIMTANGLQFTVTGLNSNTQYGYNLTAKDANDQTIATYSGSFTTTSEGIATGVEDVQGNNVQCKKVVRDGQIFILRGNKTYTITGAEVR